jgi:hypothetical protein
MRAFFPLLFAALAKSATAQDSANGQMSSAQVADLHSFEDQIAKLTKGMLEEGGENDIVLESVTNLQNMGKIPQEADCATENMGACMLTDGVFLSKHSLKSFLAGAAMTLSSLDMSSTPDLLATDARKAELANAVRSFNPHFSVLKLRDTGMTIDAAHALFHGMAEHKSGHIKELDISGNHLCGSANAGSLLDKASEKSKTSLRSTKPSSAKVKKASEANTNAAKIETKKASKTNTNAAKIETKKASKTNANAAKIETAKTGAAKTAKATVFETFKLAWESCKAACGAGCPRSAITQNCPTAGTSYCWRKPNNCAMTAPSLLSLGSNTARRAKAIRSRRKYYYQRRYANRRRRAWGGYGSGPGMWQMVPPQMQYRQPQYAVQGQPQYGMPMQPQFAQSYGQPYGTQPQMAWQGQGNVQVQMQTQQKAGNAAAAKATGVAAKAKVAEKKVAVASPSPPPAAVARPETRAECKLVKYVNSLLSSSQVSKLDLSDSGLSGNDKDWLKYYWQASVLKHDDHTQTKRSPDDLVL